MPNLHVLKRRRQAHDIFADSFNVGVPSWVSPWNGSGPAPSGLWTVTDTYMATTLVTNGLFAANITDWTDSSDAGGSIAWNAGGYMDIISNGVGTAKARGTVITTIAGMTYSLTFVAGAVLVYKVGTAAGGAQIATGNSAVGANTVTFLATTTTTYIEFSHVTNATITLDTVSILPLEPLMQVNRDMVRNGTFEYALSDVFPYWTVAGTNGAATQDADPHSGTYALKLVAGAATDKKESQTITVVPRRNYTWTFWTKGDATYGGRYGVYDVTNAADIVAVTATGVTAGTWTQKSVAFQAPWGCTSVRLDLICPSTNGGACWFDDVSMQSDVVGELSVLGGPSAWQGVMSPGVVPSAGLTLQQEMRYPSIKTTGIGFRTGTAVQQNALFGVQTAAATLLMANGLDGDWGQAQIPITMVATKQYLFRESVLSGGGYLISYSANGGISWSPLYVYSRPMPSLLYAQYGTFDGNSTSDLVRVYQGLVPQAWLVGSAPSHAFGYGANVVTNGTFETDLGGWTDGSTAPSAATWNAGKWVDITSNGAARARLRRADLSPYATVQYGWYRFSFVVGVGAINCPIGTTYGGTDIVATQSFAVGSRVLTFRVPTITTYNQFDHIVAATHTIDTVVMTPYTSGLYSLVGDPGTRNVIIDGNLTLTNAYSQKGVMWAVDDYTSATPTGLLAYYNGNDGKVYFDKVVAGVPTNLTSGSVTYGAAKRFHVVSNGASHAVYYDNALVGSVQTVPTGQGYGTQVCDFSTEDTTGTAWSIWKLSTLATVLNNTTGGEAPMGQSGIYQCTPTITAGEGGMDICFGDANNKLRAWHNATNVGLKKVVAGTSSDVVAATAAAYAAARVIKIEIQGQNAYLWYNGVYIGTGAITALGVALTGVGCQEYSSDAGADWGTFTLQQETP